MRAPFAVAAVAVCVLFAPAVLAAANCAWNGYDLSPVANDHTSATASGVLYRGVICGTSLDTRCTAYKSTASVCQYTASPPTVTGSLATWDGSGVWSQINADQPALGVQVAFTNGQSTSCPTGMTTTFKFPCGPLTTMAVTATGACNFVVTLQNPAACNGGTSGGGDDGGSKGLSGGSIFLIIFFVVVPVYIAVGCVYKRKQMGASGMESCPNIDFWRTLPGLVGDGFKFTWAKLRGLCGGSGAAGNASYDTL